jgi:hypothetical protein
MHNSSKNGGGKRKIKIKKRKIEYEYFKKYLLDFPDLIPYRTEWTVFYSKYKLTNNTFISS